MTRDDSRHSASLGDFARFVRGRRSLNPARRGWTSGRASTRWIVLTTFCIPASAAAPAPAPPTSADLAIVGGTVVDGTGRPARRDATLLVEGDRIVRIGRRSEVEVPPGAKRIDAAGRFVVPGLVDMHVHLHNPDFYPLFLANGVTSVRDLGNFERQILRYREDAALGRADAPRLFVAGPILDGPAPTWPGSLAVATPEQARREVKRLAAAGVDCLKVYNGLSRECLRAVIEEAHELKLPVTGHVPQGIDARDAILLGMDGIEHLTGVPLYAAPDGAVSDRLAVDNRAIARWWLNADAGRLEDLARLSAKRGVFHCPTLYLEECWAEASRGNLDAEPWMRFVDPLYRRGLWVEQVNPRSRSILSADEADLRAAFPKRLAFVAALVRAGAPVLSGSDTPNPFVVPGFSLHEELRLLVAAGMSPEQALASATLTAARALRVDDRLGGLKEGMLADILVVTGDPLVSVANLKRIEWVVVGGRAHAKAELNDRLESLARSFERREGRYGREPRPVKPR